MIEGFDTTPRPENTAPYNAFETKGLLPEQAASLTFDPTSNSIPDDIRFICNGRYISEKNILGVRVSREHTNIVDFSRETLRGMNERLLTMLPLPALPVVIGKHAYYSHEINVLESETANPRLVAEGCVTSLELQSLELDHCLRTSYNEFYAALKYTADNDKVDIGLRLQVVYMHYQKFIMLMQMLLEDASTHLTAGEHLGRIRLSDLKSAKYRLQQAKIVQASFYTSYLPDMKRCIADIMAGNTAPAFPYSYTTILDGRDIQIAEVHVGSSQDSKGSYVMAVRPHNGKSAIKYLTLGIEGVA